MKRVQDGQASVTQKDCLKNQNPKQTNKSKSPSGTCVWSELSQYLFSNTANKESEYYLFSQVSGDESACCGESALNRKVAP